MNLLEAAALAVALGGLALIARRCLGASWWQAGLGVLLCAPPLYLSLAETTQFLTADENGILTEMSASGQGGYSQWLSAALRTTLVQTLPPMSLLQTAGISIDLVFMLVKIMHWLFALLFIVAIGLALYRLLEPVRYRWLFVVSYCWMVFLLPIDNIALKVFNYDAIALFGGALAVLLGGLALRTGRLPYGSLAVVVAALAAQEKLIASPLLLMVIAVMGVVVGRARPTAPYRTSLMGAIVGLALGASVMLVSGLLYRAMLGAEAPTFWTVVFDPLLSWTWIPMKFVLGTSDFSGLRWASGLIVAAATLGLTCGGTFLARLADGHASVWRRTAHALDTAATIALAVTLVVGILASLVLQPYWAPFFPSVHVDLGPAAFNGVVLHFNAGSMLAHRIATAAYPYEVFVAATPTATWLMFVAAVVLRVRHPGLPVRPELDVALLGSLLAPAAIGLQQVPVGHRYMNIMLLLTVIIVLVKFVDAVEFADKVVIDQRAVLAAAGLGLALLLLEVAPFAPLYAAFRPIWLNYAHPDWPVAGEMNASWVGWGEELMLAGKRLQAECVRSPDGRLAGVPCAEVTVYTVYPGVWLEPAKRIRSEQWQAVRGREPLTSADYWVFNRSAAVQAFLLMPDGITPEFTVAFRGFVQAWVFRGDRLAEAGYRFPPP